MKSICSYCEHKNCYRLCKECKFDFLLPKCGKDVSGVICKNINNITKITMKKIYLEENEGYPRLVQVLNKSNEKDKTFYEFFLDGTEDAITGFYAALFMSDFDLLPEYNDKMQSISQYELNEFSEEQDKHFKSLNKIRVYTYNQDIYMKQFGILINQKNLLQVII